jgi:hypothetical protein
MSIVRKHATDMKKQLEAKGWLGLKTVEHPPGSKLFYVQTPGQLIDPEGRHNIPLPQDSKEESKPGLKKRTQRSIHESPKRQKIAKSRAEDQIARNLSNKEVRDSARRQREEDGTQIDEEEIRYYPWGEGQAGLVTPRDRCPPPSRRFSPSRGASARGGADAVCDVGKWGIWLYYVPSFVCTAINKP